MMRIHRGGDRSGGGVKIMSNEALGQGMAGKITREKLAPIGIEPRSVSSHTPKRGANARSAVQKKTDLFQGLLSQTQILGIGKGE